MSFVEFIGFIFSFVVMIILFAKKFMEERKRQLNPEEFAKMEKEREKNLRHFLKSRDDDFEDEEEEKDFSSLKTKTLSKLQQKQAAQQGLARLRESQRLQAVHQKKSPSVHQGNYGSETASDKKRNLAASDIPHPMHVDLNSADSYEVFRVKTTSPGSKLIKSLHSSRDMLIIKEIFDKPLSLRNSKN